MSRILVDPEDEHLLAVPWSLQGGYLAFGRRRLHREVLECPDVDVDHKWADPWDCRKASLRAVTHQENLRNRGGAQSTSSTGFLGVAVYKRLGKFQAFIHDTGGKFRSLGYFTTPEAANLRRLVVEHAWWGIQPRRAQAFKDAGIG